MKTIICFLALALSVIVAAHKENALRAICDSNKLLYEIAQMIKEDRIFKMTPIGEILSKSLNASCCDYPTCLDILKAKTSNAISASDIYEKLSEFTDAVLSNIDEKCNELIEITRLGYEKASAEYLKCKRTVYLVYPGITAMIAIVFI